MTGEELPARLAARPLDARRRVPVPFAQAIRPDGTADFSALDAQLVMRCARERLCGLCGQPLEYWLAFIGGPGSIAARTFTDPPMHITPCAEAAFTLCPHLARPLVSRRPASDSTTVPEGWAEAKPSRWGMGLTRDFRLQRAPAEGGGQAWVLRAAPFRRIRWWEYLGGRAVEVTG